MTTEILNTENRKDLFLSEMVQGQFYHIFAMWHINFVHWNSFLITFLAGISQKNPKNWYCHFTSICHIWVELVLTKLTKICKNMDHLLNFAWIISIPMWQISIKLQWNFFLNRKKRKSNWKIHENSIIQQFKASSNHLLH